MTNTELAILAVLGLFALCLLVACLPLFVLYLRSRAANAPVQMMELIGMRLRRVNARKVVDARIQSAKAGLSLPTTQLEIHTLAGGNIDRVVPALIEARRKGMSLTWNEAAAYDLVGRDVLAAVRAGVTPRVGVQDNIPRMPEH